MNRKIPTVFFATFFSIAILVLGYVSFGLWVMLIFSSGFLTGLILWLLLPTETSWSYLKVPYWLTLVLFMAHRVEEKISDFFKILSDVTNTPAPDIISVQIILLVSLSVIGWLFIPLLIKRGKQFGYYLAWTFFTSMGITELAHFVVFPFLIDKSYGYFPGMISVVFLAPVAWWGIYHLLKKNVPIETTIKGYGD